MKWGLFIIWQLLVRKVRKWLEVPSRSEVTLEVVNHFWEVQRMLDRRQATLDRLEKQLADQRKEADRLLAEAERVASRTTIAASDVLTALQLFKQGYDPGLARGEEEEEKESDESA